MTNRRNYYRILHVQPDAPQALIKSSYRTLMSSLNKHPDRGGEHSDAVLINQAYATLRDPQKREAYDRELLQRHTKADLSGMPTQQQNPRSRGDPAEYQPIISDFCPFCQTPLAPSMRIGPKTRCHECECPLHPAGDQTIAGATERALDRMPRADEIRIFTDWPQQGFLAHTRDLSPAGMQFISAQALADNHFIKIVGNGIAAIGRVVSCRKEANTPEPCFAVGVAFVTLEFEQARGTFVSHAV